MAPVFGCEVTNAQIARGTIPIDSKEFTIKGAIPNPAQACAYLFAIQLEKKGMPIEHQSLEQKTEKVPIHTTSSPSIKQIIHAANQESINLYAEHLLKKMGEVISKEGSTQGGIQAVTAFWKSQQVNLRGFHLADGSGLSRKNLITAKQLVAILQKMRASEYFPLFLESLPQQVGLIKAKSGSMSQIRCYAGYAGTIAFALLINHATDKATTRECVEKVFSHLNRLAENYKPN